MKAEKKGNRRKALRKAACVAAVLAGAALLAYPWVSEWLYENQTASEAAAYEAEAEDMEAGQKEKLLAEAEGYNKTLAASQVKLTDPFRESGELSPEYAAVLRFNDEGVMGYVDIPKINVYLPIYHGTSAETLEAGIGHLEGSSLPVGGEGTHAVLTGHTGLNRARLFTDLTALVEGDVFFIRILGETLAYEVYGIETVLPEDQGSLHIEAGEDLVTLVTCTPYGVNDHRLLVHGKRTEYTEETYRGAVEENTGSGDSQWLSSYEKALLLGIAVSAGILALVFLVQILRKTNVRQFALVWELRRKSNGEDRQKGGTEASRGGGTCEQI